MGDLRIGLYTEKVARDIESSCVTARRNLRESQSHMKMIYDKTASPSSIKVHNHVFKERYKFKGKACEIVGP